MKKIAIIATVGDSSEPLINHINNTNPNLVCFLYTTRTEKNIDFIVAKSNIEKHIDIFLKNPNNVDDTFSKSLNSINDLLRKGYEVIGNFTPGTKPMSVGLAMACVEKKCAYEYGYGDRDKETGMSKSFKENISQDNPYEKYAINQFKRGRWFFNRYQFLASHENFKYASDIVDDENLKKRSDLLIKLVNFYDNWDKFNDENLNVYLENILNEISNDSSLNDYFTLESQNFYNQMKKNLRFLEKKDNPLIYLPDLLNNALRRIDEGKFDDAVARLYRALELIAQLQLLKYRVVDEKTFHENKAFRVEVAKLKSKKTFNTISANFNTKKDYLDRLDLNNDYLLLDLLSQNKQHDLDRSSQKLVRSYKNIHSRFELRNKSILAHGLKPLNERDAKNIYKSILKHSKILCSNIENEMETAKFPFFEEE